MSKYRRGGKPSNNSESEHHTSNYWRGSNQLFIGSRHQDKFLYSEENKGGRNDWILGYKPKSDGDILDVTALLAPNVTIETLGDYVSVRTIGFMTRLTIELNDTSAVKHIWLVGTRIRGIDELKDLAASGKFVFSNDYNWTPVTNSDGYYDGGEGEDTVTVTLTGTYNNVTISPAENGNIIIQFEDGPTLTVNNVEELVINGTDFDDTIVLAGDFDSTDLAYNTITSSLGLGNDTFDASAIPSFHRTVVDGGAGDDILLGGSGADILKGNAGNDALLGGLGADYLDGGAGDDTLIGDVLYTPAADASVDDNLRGGDGNDSLSGQFGDDLLEGGSGDDTLDGGTGVDTADYGYVQTGQHLNLNLTTGTAEIFRNGVHFEPTAVERDDLTSIENVKGTSGNDEITGNNADNKLDGGGGIDILKGGFGDDLYIVDETLDQVIEYSGGGTDEVQASQTYTLADHIENLTLLGSADFSGTGNNFDNVLAGNSGNNQLFGMGGNDRFIGSLGYDSFYGGAGYDTADYSTFENGTTGGVNANLALGLAYDIETPAQMAHFLGEIENVIGSKGNDHLEGDDGANILTGLGGNDTFIGTAGNDTYWGGSGHDTLYLSGSYMDYQITGDDGFASVDGVEGLDSLFGVEAIVFSTGQVGTYYLDGTENTLPPSLESLTVTTDENAAPGVLGAVSAVHPQGSAIHFAITGGVDADRFSIDAVTGEISALVPLNHEDKSQYNLEITGTDAAGLYDQSIFTIAVNDVNEAADIDAENVMALGIDAGTVDMRISLPVDPEGDPLTISILSLPTNGEVRLAGGGLVTSTSILTAEDLSNLTFTPITPGGARFEYQVDDGNGGISIGVINIDLSPDATDLNLVGKVGDDLLIGSAGSDVMSGGEGADTFVFDAADRGLNVITDFTVEDGDILDLTALFANLSAAEIENRITLSSSGGDTVMIADVDGDGLADMSITFQNANLIAGQHDPVMSGAKLGGVTEVDYVAPGQLLTDTGIVHFSDNDPFDVHLISSIKGSAGALGNLTANLDRDVIVSSDTGLISWEYNVSALDVEYLSAGEVRIETFDIELKDNNGGVASHQIEIQITGTNDRPTVNGVGLIGHITEQNGFPFPVRDLTAENQISFIDYDLSDTHRITSISAPEGALGSMSAFVSSDSTGSGTGLIDWNYAVANTAVEYLAAGEIKIETFEVTLADQNGATSTRSIDVVIHGTNDRPYILGGDDRGSVKEISVNAPGVDLKTGGYLNFFDEDLSDNHTLSISSVDTYGTLTAVVSPDTPDSSSRGIVNWEYNIDAYTVNQLLTDVDSRVEEFQITIDDGNGGTSTKTVEVILDGGDVTYASNSFHADFSALGQSIWGEDAGDIIYDKFWGFEFDDHFRSDLFDVLDTRLTAALRTSFKAGFDAYLELDEGSVNADIGFDINIDSIFDTGKNTLTLDTSAMLSQGGGFQTNFAGGNFDAELILEAAIKLWAEFKPPFVDEFDILNFGEAYGGSASLQTLDDLLTDATDDIGSLTYGDIQNISTIAHQIANGDFTSTGENENFFNFVLDIDQLLSAILIPPDPTGNIINPFDFEVDTALVDGRIEFLDLDATLGTNLIQNFDMSVEGLGGIIEFTEYSGRFDSTVAFTFGETLEIDISRLSDYDGGDGIIDYRVIMDPFATFNNNTDIGVNAGVSLDILDVEFSYDIGVDSGAVNPDPVYSPDVSFNLLDFDAYDANFDLNFLTTTTDVFSFDSTGDNLAPEARTAHFYVDENTQPQSVGTVIAYDPEGSDLFYEIYSGDPNGYFSIDSATGEISTTQALDFESTARHNLFVRVTDGEGASNTTYVVVDVEDVAEGLTVTGFTSQLEENKGASLLGVVVVSGATSPTDLSYAITAGDPFNLFEIDSSSGEISTRGPLDYEQSDQHVLTITVTDGINPPALTTVSLNVTNIAEGISVTGFSADVDENAGPALLGNVTANDPDNGTISFEIIDGNADGFFTIHSVTGAISTTADLDRESASGADHTLTIRATDAGGEMSTTLVSVSVNDVNEAPQMQAASVTIDENGAAGVVATAVATDPDVGDAVTYSIVAGNETLFSVNALTGAVSVNGPLDHEAQDEYQLSIKATDTNGLSDVVILTVHVANVAEGLTATGFTNSISENAGAGVVGFVTSNDPDQGLVTYEITGGNASGAFSIVEATGQLSTTGDLDHEFNGGVYNLIVTATDSDGEMATADVTVNALNVNEAPILTNIIVDVDENGAAAAIADMAGLDPDLGDTLTYSIVAGNDEVPALFSIDSATGVVSTTGSLDYEAAAQHTLNVQAMDAGGLTAHANVTVNVGNLPDVPSGQSDWIGVSDDSWHNAANWSGSVPTNGSNVTIDGALTSNPIANYNVGSISIADLTLTSGGLGISGGTLALADVSAVADGALLDVMTGGTLKIDAKLDVRGTLQLNGGSLAGSGIIDLDQGNLSLLSDYSTGTGPKLDFFAQAAGNTGITTVNGPGILTNAAGQSTYFVNDQINTGLENVGDIQVSGQTAFNGTFDNTLGATLRVATDDTTTSYPLGTLVIDQGFTNAGDLILDDLSLGRTGANLTVTSGVLTNMGTILSANSIEDTDNYTHALTASVDNQGSLDIDHDLTMRFGSDPAFVNSGTIDVDRNHTLRIDSADADLNAGTQIDGEGILYFFRSTVDVNTKLNTDTYVEFFQSTVNLGVDFSTLESTNAKFYGGQINSVNGTETITNVAGERLFLDGGVRVNTDVINEGTLFTQGNIYGNFTNTGTVFATGGTAVHLAAGDVFTNDGDMRLTGGGGFAVNQAGVNGGTFINNGAIQGDATSGGILNGNITNNGLIEVNNYMQFSLNGRTFDTSTGTLDVKAGTTLEVSFGTFTITEDATLLGSGTINFTGSLYSIGRLVTDVDLVNGAEDSLVWDFGSSAKSLINAVDGDETLTNDQGGILKAYNDYFDLDVINEGVFDIFGDAGFYSDLTAASDGTIAIHIGGNTQGTQYTHLATRGDVSLDGTLDIAFENGFTPTLGASFEVMTWLTPPVGTFAQLSGVDAGNGLMLMPTYTATGLILTVVDPTDMTWNGNAGDGDWHNPANWNAGVPVANNSVILDGAAEFSAGASQLAGLTVAASSTLDVTGGDLDVAIASSFAAGSTLNLENGTFGGDGEIITDGDFNWTGGSLTGGGDMTVNGVANLGATLTLDKTLTLAGGDLITLGSGVMDGTGTLNLANTSGGLNLTGNQIFNVDVNSDALMSVSGSGNVINGAYSGGNLANISVLADAGSNASLEFATGFENRGTITLDNLDAGAVNAATLTVLDGALINRGTLISQNSGGGGNRVLAAELNNQDTVQVNHDLTIARAGALHQNNDVINVDASLLTFGDHFTGEKGSDIFLTNGASLAFDTISLGGTLHLSMNGAAENDVFNIASWNSKEGAYEKLTGFELGNNLLLDADISATGFEGTAVAITTGGHNGHNTIEGTAARDVIDGKGGNDHLDGAAGNDYLFGGAGDDTLIGGEGSDVLNGGEGNEGDMADYSNDSAGIIVHLDEHWAQDGSGGIDTLININNIAGSDYADQIVGNANSNELFGGDGDDTLIGGEGIDRLTGGAGADTFTLDTADNSHMYIVDYDVNEDIIDLDALFDSLGIMGTEDRLATITEQHVYDTFFTIATPDGDFESSIRIMNEYISINELTVDVS